MNDSLGTPGWARRVLGPVVEPSGFRPGKKNARWASFVRDCADGRKMNLDFNPSPWDARSGGSFALEIRFDLNAWSDNYSAGFMTFVLPTQVKEAMTIRNGILVRLPHPLSYSMTGVAYNNGSFDWLSEADLDSWVTYVGKVLPTVMIRAESGTRQNSVLRPGPGPECDAGEIDHRQLIVFAEDVLDAWMERVLSPVLAESGFERNTSDSWRSQVRTCVDGRTLTLDFTNTWAEPPTWGGAFRLRLCATRSDGPAGELYCSEVVELLSAEHRKEFIAQNNAMWIRMPYPPKGVFAGLPSSPRFDWLLGRDFAAWSEFLRRVLRLAVLRAELGALENDELVAGAAPGCAAGKTDGGMLEA